MVRTSERRISPPRCHVCPSLSSRVNEVSYVLSSRSFLIVLESECRGFANNRPNLGDEFGSEHAVERGRALWPGLLTSFCRVPMRVDECLRASRAHPADCADDGSREHIFVSPAGYGHEHHTVHEEFWATTRSAVEGCAGGRRQRCRTDLAK